MGCWAHKFGLTHISLIYSRGPFMILCLLYQLLMPQSHCAESTPEWGRIDNSSLFEWSFLVNLDHSSNDNDNENQFEQCSSHPCNFGRLVRKFWTSSKSLYTQQCPVRILFIRGYAHWKHVVIFFGAQLTCCILVILIVFVVVLIVYYVIRTDSETGADQKTVRTMTNGAARLYKRSKYSIFWRGCKYTNICNSGSLKYT